MGLVHPAIYHRYRDLIRSPVFNIPTLRGIYVGVRHSPALSGIIKTPLTAERRIVGRQRKLTYVVGLSG